MTELLVEIYTEEIPAKMQKNAVLDFLEKAKKTCEKNNISLENAETYISPTRLVLYATNVRLISEQIEKKGPAANADEKIILNFAKANNTNIDKLTVKSTLKGDFYFYITEDMDISSILQTTLEELLLQFTWPKAMKWEVETPVWVRPIRSILCLYNNQILPIKFGALTASNITYGHKFLAPSPLTIRNFDDYKTKLAESFIHFDHTSRKKYIIDSVAKLCEKNNLTAHYDEMLIDEITGLVDFPVTLEANFAEGFLSLPEEVLIIVMKNHQRYIPLYDNTGKITNKFIIIANVPGNDLIINGNQKVITARFKDAEFFYTQDIKIGIDNFIPKLKEIIFHRKLHSIYEKSQNIVKISKYIAKEIGADIEKAEKAAHLIKADLTTNMVKEFPELQGIMGYYYALDAGYEMEIAVAIRDHYKLIEENISSFPTLFIVSLADRIDSLVGLFHAGEKPTGSKDPYALRRLAIAIIKLATHEKYNIDLNDIFKFTQKLYGNELSSEALNYLIQRIYSLYPEIKKFYIDHYIKSCLELNLKIIISSARKLNNLMSTSQGDEIISLYNRINNIIAGHKIDEEVIQENLFSSSHEQEMYKIITELPKYLNNSDNLFEQIEILLSNNKIIKEFFDNVLINVEDEKIKNNRIKILMKLKIVFNSVIDFDNLVKEV